MSRQSSEDNEEATGKSLACYFHDVSNVQKAQLTNRRYFNCIVQSKDKKPIRAVCYSPEKQREMVISVAKSPVKMRNFKQEDDGDLVITKFTSITPVSKDDADFEFSEQLSASTSGKPVKLSLIHDLAGEQLISVKSEVASISSVKVIATASKGKTEKKDVIIRDPTASFKIVFWGKYVDSVELKKTYLFQNLKVKVTKYERYLNTPFQEKFTATECEAFSTPLVDVDEDVNTISSFNGNILGVVKASKSLACIGCQKRPIDVMGTKAVCHSCNLAQLSSSCPIHWSVRLLVKPDGASRNLRLTLASDMMEKFVAVMETEVTLQTVSEDDLTLLILDSCSKKFKVTFDTIGYEITDLAVI